MADTLFRDLKRFLEEGGCHCVRSGKGSHEIWYSPKTKKNFPVPTNIKSRHTANAILKQAGLRKAL